MNQYDFVKKCLEFYEEGGWSPEKGWEEAHYPAPENKGNATIWMQHDHHQVQALWQSKEYDQCCFYNGHAKRFLTEGPFVSGWFELWDIYDKYSGENGRKAAELGVGIHAPEMRGVGGKKAAELGVGAHAPGTRSKGGEKGGKTTAAQKWQSTDPNHSPHIAPPGPLSNWQKARGIDTSMRVRLT
jgi:hypothetical protein